MLLGIHLLLCIRLDSNTVCRKDPTDKNKQLRCEPPSLLGLSRTSIRKKKDPILGKHGRLHQRFHQIALISMLHTFFGHLFPARHSPQSRSTQPFGLRSPSNAAIYRQSDRAIVSAQHMRPRAHSDIHPIYRPLTQ